MGQEGPGAGERSPTAVIARELSPIFGDNFPFFQTSVSALIAFYRCREQHPGKTSTWTLPLMASSTTNHGPLRSLRPGLARIPGFCCLPGRCLPAGLPAPSTPPFPPWLSGVQTRYGWSTAAFVPPHRPAARAPAQRVSPSRSAPSHQIPWDPARSPSRREGTGE